MKSWLDENGLDIQAMAPYSPSQNGIAECMNRMLVELGRTMLKGQDLPEFLWDFVNAHAAYLRNRSYTKVLKNQTSYQKWNKSKLNVNHLRKFGAPVWVLLQGEKKPRKMLPKSQKRAYIGFDDRSKSVTYCNAETRKVLTSQNHCFLSITNGSLLEEIVVAPDLLLEGEMEKSMLPTSSDSRKRKRVDEEVPEVLMKRTKKGIDYRYLNDPYLDNDDLFMENDEQSLQTFAVDPNDIPESLEEAKKSSEWVEWENAIKIELDQLANTGTWELVDKPKDAIPMVNKFVFNKKGNKAGKITKYKARLVAKGCSQRPGYDYQETFSPIV